MCPSKKRRGTDLGKLFYQINLQQTLIILNVLLAMFLSYAGLRYTGSKNWAILKIGHVVLQAYNF